MLLWFWYCKWRILADNSFATDYKRYEINSVNKVYYLFLLYRTQGNFDVKKLTNLTNQYESSIFNSSNFN